VYQAVELSQSDATPAASSLISVFWRVFSSTWASD